MPKEKDPNRNQFVFDFSVPAASLDDASDTDVPSPSDPPSYRDPEAVLAKLHDAMDKGPTPFCKLINDDIRHQVNREMKILYEIWDVPTDEERQAELKVSFHETILFLRRMPFRDTNVMAYMESHKLNSSDIKELLITLAGQFATFKDIDSSEGFRWHATLAAFIRNQVTERTTPKKFQKKR